MLRQQLEVALSAYEQDNGAFPPVLENYQLVKTLSGDNSKKAIYFSPSPNQINANHEYLDGWGTPLRISFISKDNVLILSAGPDKIFGTADDITNQ